MCCDKGGEGVIEEDGPNKLVVYDTDYVGRPTIELPSLKLNKYSDDAVRFYIGAGAGSISDVIINKETALAVAHWIIKEWVSPRLEY